MPEALNNLSSLSASCHSSATAVARDSASVRSKITSRRIVTDSQPDGLADLYQENVNIAIWQRQLEDELTRECQTLMTSKSFSGHRLALPSSKFSQLDQVFSDLAPFPLLLSDIQLLIEMYSCLFELDAVGLRLTPLRDSMCPKFHVDRVPCRLITTYLGKGTQWLPHDCVDRSKLGAGSAGLNDRVSGLYSDERSIQSLAPGDVALLKGELWEENEGAGLVHRSPAVEPEETRLLLTLDFA